MKILALSGHKGSGKDTVADFLSRNYGYIKVSFAELLKDIASREYNIPRELFDDREKKDKPLLNFPVKPKDDFSLMVANFMFREFKDELNRQVEGVYINDNGEFRGHSGRDSDIELYHTPRSLAILKGNTNRTVDPDYWLNSTITAMKNIKNTYKLKNNEAKFVISDVRFENEVTKLKETFQDNVKVIRINRDIKNTSKDPSEVELDTYEFDHIIENTSSLEELFLNTSKLMLEEN